MTIKHTGQRRYPQKPLNGVEVYMRKADEQLFELQTILMDSQQALQEQSDLVHMLETPEQRIEILWEIDQ